MENAGTVDIILPCFNAALWIDGFVAGLLELEGISWRLIARDDASSDATLDILREWRERLGSRLRLLDDEAPRNLGIIGNYDAVLAASTAPWVLTADPDDIWLPERVPVTLTALRAVEAEFGAETPVAVCTDARVVNEDLTPVAPSYWRWSRTRPPARPTLARTAMDSVALGSTMTFNRALIAAARPLPPKAAYQDWWLAMVAVTFGHFVAVPEATILYRRHGENATKDPYTASLMGALQRTVASPFNARRRLHYLIGQAAYQAEEFATRYADRLPASEADAVRALARLREMRPLARRYAILRHGLWFNSLLKNAGLLALL
jgi:glycosyltransferase involved in cell wall biosynthesis